MKTLVVTLGSAGDLHPFLAMARGLAERGEDVEVMSNAPYEDAVRREGLAFTALCSERDHQRTAEHPDLWHPIRGFGVLWRHLAVPAIEPVRARVAALLPDASAARGERGLRVLASPLAVGARLAREQSTFGLCSVYTAPANLRSTGDPMFVGSWQVPRWLPRVARRAMWWGLDRRKLEPMARPAVDAAHQALGLAAPRGSLFGDWIHSPDGGLTLFPASFCERQPDWPARLEMADFPLFRAAGDEALPAELEAFLQGGAPPVVVFPGSASAEHGRRLLRDALVACRALGLRVVVLGAAPDPAPGNAAPSRAAGPAAAVAPSDELIHFCPHASLERLLPRAAVFMHHGGIGSCAQGLRARVAQLVRPFAYDQFDNAARIEASGAGRFIPNGAKSRVVFLQALEELAQGVGAIAQRDADNAFERGVPAVLQALDRWQARLGR